MPENLNSTMNGKQPLSCNNPSAEKIGKTVACLVIFLVSLAGNISIGVIVYKTKTLRKPINFLILNMALSDVLSLIFFIPQQIQMLYIKSWLIGGPLGQALCKLFTFLPHVSFVVSIQSLVLIAVDRFGAVVYPFRSPLISSKLCPFFILATWIVAMTMLSPYLFALKLFEQPAGLGCVLQWNEAFGESSSAENYRVSNVIVFKFIPLVLIAILYIIIYIKLKSQNLPGEQSANAGQQRQQRERNVLKMSIAIVLGFAVCLLPYAISLILVGRLNNITWSCGLQYFFAISVFMAYANCAINPCICFIFSRNYRAGLKTLLRYKWS